MRYIAGTQRGLARGEGNIAAIPPEGAAHWTFFQAAGVLYFDVTVNAATSEKRQIQEQADDFYYSGHGTHSDGHLSFGGASVVAGHWADIDKFIVAGCAVLDINDYNNHYTGAAHTNSPGLQWITTSPDVLLGYNWVSPVDGACSDDNFTKDIIVGYLTSSETGDVSKWMWANRNKAVAVGAAHNDDAPGQRPWNACALTRGTTEWIYWYWDFNTLGDDGKPVLAHKHQSAW